MFKMVQAVIKGKNKQERVKKQFRQDEMQMLKSKAAYKARLSDDLRDINFMLDDRDVSAVIITIPPEYLASFAGAIHTDDLAEYNIEQLESSADSFKISRRVITL